MEKKPVMVKEDLKALKAVKEDINVEPVEKKTKITGEEVESQKPIVNKERNIDLQLDLGKADGDSATVAISRNKLLQQPNTDKIAQSSSLPLPMSMTGWPGGLPHMGYMAPLQGVVSMDGSTASSAAVQPPHIIFSQPRPKRCATHCYIARNIQCHQQCTRMNPFWPPAAGSALQHGAKACNMNGVPSTDLHADTAQRKQILLQQALPPRCSWYYLAWTHFHLPIESTTSCCCCCSRSCFCPVWKCEVSCCCRQCSLLGCLKFCFNECHSISYSWSYTNELQLP
ncbi:hypothetical protein OIU78_004522 [Salix suchowensis]|nr:hypothetical protein OIU78_004522 [Salix suchowensis]